MLTDLADYLWDNPETAFSEYLSAEAICTKLKEEGFFVNKNLAEIPTAFEGRFGSGKPVIGFIGEYDALSDMAQESGSTERSGSVKGNGHGCGHNLIGAGSLGAAIAVKRYLEETKCEGTVVYFGCPGEEGGSGKTFMARDGVFDGVDAVLGWHPDCENRVYTRTSLANCQTLYKFEGVSSHAGTQPHLGRSALDAVELMNVGVNFLREHMPQDARIHYAITDTGGFSPNVVQSHSEVLYLVRSADALQLAELQNRVDDIADGAALMTGTSVKKEMIKACSNTVLNHTLQSLLYKNMQIVGAPVISKNDVDFAERLIKKNYAQFISPTLSEPIHNSLVVYDGEVTISCGSTDVGDVSWVCPTAQILTASYAYGTPNHSWLQTAQGKLPLAHNSMIFAAKVLAVTAVDLLKDKTLLIKAKEEHDKKISPSGYICPIPDGLRPRAINKI